MNEAGLLDLQRGAFDYFDSFADPETGLVQDSSRSGSDGSIAAVGMALSCYPVAAERALGSRTEMARRTATTLRTLWYGPPDGIAAIGHRGFFYHFFDVRTAHRTRRSELSTIDTAILVAGALTAAEYFDRDVPLEEEIRWLAHLIYERVDWAWALAGGETVSMGWRPGAGFHRTRWEGYSEALLLYVLALGSPTHPIPPSSYHAWARHHRWRRIYGVEHLYAGQLFVHALPQAWLDLRGLRDAFMRDRGIDYFENSRRTLLVQREYATRNPRRFEGYGPRCWGVSASDGPGPDRRSVAGRERSFWDYKGRGVPWGADDGTLAPWAVAASIPFDPPLVADVLAGLSGLVGNGPHGLLRSVNPTYGNGRGPWISGTRFGIDQGPVVLMIENHLNRTIWELTRRSIPVVRGLEQAGFRGGWLSAAEARPTRGQKSPTRGQKSPTRGQGSPTLGQDSTERPPG